MRYLLFCVCSERLSSLRNKGHDVNKPSPLSLPKERRHSPRSSATPSPKTPTTRSSSKQSNRTNIDDVLFKPILESLPLKSKSKVTHETSTLPRRFESNLKQDSRGSKPYSSARYTSTQKDISTRRSKLSRHGSFQGSNETRVQVSPMLNDPNNLSLENSDVLENLSHFKASAFQYPSNSHELSYQGMLNETSQVGYSSGQSRFENSSIIGRESLRRVKQTLDTTPYTTIPEVVSETVDSTDEVPPPMPVKRRRSQRDPKKNYSFVNVNRNGPTALDSNAREPSQATNTQEANPEPKMVFAVDRPLHSSLRREGPKKGVPLKRGMSLYGMTDSPTKQYPLSKYDTTYMPSALSPNPINPEATTGEKPPPSEFKN